MYFDVLGFFLFFSVALGSDAPLAPYYDLTQADEYFADFIKKYERKYESAEELDRRFEIFKRNLKQLNEWNSNYTSENGGFIISQFEDHEGPHSCADISQMQNVTLVQVKKESIINAPESIDYRNLNLVTPAKQQGQCGACYIFAAVENIEGVHAKQYPGQLISLSEQQALDCFDENTCTGGLAENVIRDLIRTGSMAESDYPYVAIKGICRADPHKVRVRINGVRVYQTPDIESLKGALYENGAPIAITMYASGQFERSPGYGVYTPSPSECNSETFNHAVLLVGYGRDAASGKNYWLIKNSWGTERGENGFYKFDMNNRCRFGLQHTCTAY